VGVGVTVLLVSPGWRSLSWRTAYRRLRAEASARDLDLGEYVATSSDPTPTTVFLEDSAALVGLALVALVLRLVTGSPVWDGVASLLIGLLLIVVALVLVRRNGALLVDEAAPADVRQRLRRVVAAEPWVAEVAELTAVDVGPRHLLVLVQVVPVQGADPLARVWAGCWVCRRSPRWRSRRSSRRAATAGLGCCWPSCSPRRCTACR